MPIEIGVAAFQGAWREHVSALERCGATARPLRGVPGAPLDGVVIPGGESTVIGRLGESSGLFAWLHESAARGMPIFGTCAGAILMARGVEGVPPPDRLAIFPVSACRNAYGRQRESFEAPLLWCGAPDFPGVFIRAPRLKDAAPDVEILARLEDEPVGMRWRRLFAATFHPELTEDRRFHALFLEACAAYRGERDGGA